MTTTPAPTPQPIRVRATARGFYDNQQRDPGDVFAIATEDDYSKAWMQRVDNDTPLTQREPGGRQPQQQTAPQRRIVR